MWDDSDFVVIHISSVNLDDKQTTDHVQMVIIKGAYKVEFKRKKVDVFSALSNTVSVRCRNSKFVLFLNAEVLIKHRVEIVHYIHKSIDFL